MKRLAVYCGSATPEDPRLMALAREVGAGTHPGAGIPGVVGSAKAAEGIVLEDLAVKASA